MILTLLFVGLLNALDPPTLNPPSVDRHVQELKNTPQVKDFWPSDSDPNTKVICISVMRGPACFTKYGQEQRLKNSEWGAWYEQQ